MMEEEDKEVEALPTTRRKDKPRAQLCSQEHENGHGRMDRDLSHHHFLP